MQHWKIIVATVSTAFLVSILKADAPPSRYVLTNETVADTKTGLVWQRHVEEASANVPPATYCQQLTLAGGGWRGPTFKELLTLIDPSRVEPAMDPQAFPGESTLCCRAVNTVTDSGRVIPTVMNVGVFMRYGVTGPAADSTLVRCVR